MNPTTATQIAAALTALIIIVAIALILTHKTPLQTARTALKQKLTELFTEPSEEAKHFRTRILYRHPNIEALKQQLLEEAETWTPDTIQPHPTAEDSTVMTGRLYKLYTEVTIKNGKATYTLIEVD